MGMIVSPVKGAFRIDPEVFRLEAERRWAPHVKVAPSGVKVPALVAVVTRPDDSLFQARLHENAPMLVIEGTEAQEFEVAVWVRSLFPPDVPLWLTNRDYSAHVELRAGMNAGDLQTADWVEHGEGFVDPLEDQ